MALRRRLCFHACLLLFMGLLLMADAGPISGPPAEAVLGRKDGGCYKTAASVPQKCSAEFIRALYTDNEYKISAYCCVRLFCVAEASCDSVLRSVCPPREMAPRLPPNKCPPP